MIYVWVTKYALTLGVVKCRLAADYEQSQTLVTCEWPGGLNGTLGLGATDFATSREDAIKQAWSKRHRAWQAAMRRADKLSTMQIEVPE